MDKHEKDPLLIKGNAESKTKNHNKSFPYYIFSAVIIIFACALDLQGRVLSLYLYEIVGENQGNATTNSSNKTNSSTYGGGACGRNDSSSSDDAQQEEASTWSWYFSLLQYGLTLVLMVVIGVTSDTFGRKPYMMVCLLGAFLKSVSACIIVYKRPSVYYLYIVYAIAGVSGGSSVFEICCLALIADLTKRNNSRTMGLAVFDVLIGIGLSGTEIATGYLVQRTGYVWACVIASSLAFLCSVTYFIFIPETLKKSETPNESVCNKLVDLLKFYFSNTHFYGKKVWIFNLATVTFIIAWVVFGAAISTFYELGFPFCWLPEQIGWFESGVIVSHLLIGVSILKLLQRCLKDEVIAMMGCISAMSYKLIFGLANASWVLYIGINVKMHPGHGTGGPVMKALPPSSTLVGSTCGKVKINLPLAFTAPVTGVLSTIPLPILRAIMSRMVKEEKQGALFSNICIWQAACSLGSYTLFNNIYTGTQDLYRGFVFFVMAGFYLTCAFLFIPLIVEKHRRNGIELETKQ